MQDDDAPYRGSRPYKVSKRPTNDGLGDDDISNLVKNLSKQDLDKILEFASGNDKYSQKGNSVDYEYSRPHKRENSQRPPYTKDFYKGNVDNKYQAEKTYEIEFKKYINYVTEATPINYTPKDERRNPYAIESEPNQLSFYGPQNDGPPQFKTYSEQDNAPPPYRFGSQGRPTNALTPEDDSATAFNGLGAQDTQPNQYKPFVFQDNQVAQLQPYGPRDTQIPVSIPNDSQISQNFGNPQGTNVYPGSSDSDFTETNEEEKLPPPTNMREVDYDASFTNNVPTVVKAETDSDSYQVESFGDLPLMNYNSKLHSVSSYHVPHYTVSISDNLSSLGKLIFLCFDH